MTISSKLMNAILSMDSYNRGYGASLEVGGDAINTYIGKYKVVGNSGLAFDDEDQDVGFYAIAYENTVTNEITISYRGTDQNISWPWETIGSDLWNGYGVGGGFPTGAWWTGQAELAFLFYQDVADAQASTTGVDPRTADISVTGHSLGGGLAGLVGAVYGKQGDLFDNMAFELAAELSYDYSTPGGAYNSDVNQTVYRGETAWAVDADSLRTTYMEGEFLTVDRLLQDTPQDGLTLGDDVDLPGALDAMNLHSMSSLVIRMFASEQEYGLNWDTSAKYFWPVLYDDSFAEDLDIAEGLSGTDVTAGGYASVLRTMLAYSVIDEGLAPDPEEELTQQEREAAVRPFGDTGVRSLYNDANDFGTALGTLGSPEIIEYVGEEISKAFVEYAGYLAKEKVLQSGNGGQNEAFMQGALFLQSGTLVTDFSDSKWNVSSSGVPEIVSRDLLAEEVFIYGISAGYTVSLIDVSAYQQIIGAGMQYVWGTQSYDVIEKIVIPYEVTNHTVASQVSSSGNATLLYAADALVNTITGSSGDDLILAGSYNQTIAGSEGSDVVYGGLGLDTIDYSTLTEAVTVRLGAFGYATVAKDAEGEEKDALVGVERFLGTDFNDVYEVTDFNYVQGLFLNGQKGIDTLDFTLYQQGGLSISLAETKISGKLTATNAALNLPNTLLFRDIENLTGTKFNDNLAGSDGMNVLTGGKGVDVLTGGKGLDSFAFVVGDGHDIVTDYKISEGDYLHYTGGIHPSSLQFSRPDGTDDILISAHGDSVRLKNIFSGPGDADNHVIVARFDSGIVTFIIEPTGVATALNLTEPSAGGGSQGTAGLSLTGTSGDDVLNGSDYNDRIYGLEGDDRISGQGGNDTITGNDGNDNIDGGAGDDVIGSGTGNNIISGGEGNDTIRVNNNGGNNLVFGGDGNDVIDRTTAPGSLSTLGGKNYLYGEDGDDTIWVVSGNDYIDGGDGNDYIQSETEYNHEEDDINTLIGGEGNDTIYTGWYSNNIIIDGAGEDFYYISPGATGIIHAAVDGEADTYHSTQNKGILSFAAGSQGITINSNGTISSTEFGNDTITGGAAAFEMIIGTSGNDVFLRDATSTTYDGGAGDDYFENIGADFWGAYGAPLIGGSGSDTFALKSRGIRMEILDYSFAEGDILLQSDEIELSHLVGSRDGDDLHIDQIHIDMSGFNVIDAFTLQDFFLTNSKILVEFDSDGQRAVLSVDSSGNLSLESAVADNGDNTLFAGSGGEYLAGYGGNDTLTGGIGVDTLDGGTGADLMAGGDGNDTYIVDDFADVVIEAADEGIDTVLSSGSYELGTNVENLTLTGTFSIDGIGNALANIISGNNGNNILSGMAGSDIYAFGEGGSHDVIVDADGTLDTIVFDASVDKETVSYFRLIDDLVISYGELGDTITIQEFFASADTIEEVTFDDTTVHNATYINAHLEAVAGSFGADTLTGTTGNEVLSGLGGEDILQGLDGDDTLDGGAGNDSLFGGDGDDVYAFSEGSGHDAVEDSEGTQDQILLDNGIMPESVIYVQSGDDLLIRYGSQGDTITVKDYFTSLDTVEEVLFADSTVHDSTYIASHLELPYGTSGNDTLSGTLGDDTLEGLAGSDILRGFAGDDLLDGGDGADTMIGGLGNDAYILDNIGDVVVEAINEGNDTVISSISHTLSANVENLVLSGSANLDAIGNVLNNNLTGNTGNNMLDGGDGVDVMAGGDGDDVYVVDQVDDIVIEDENEGIDTVLSSITWTLDDHVENLTLTGSENINAIGNSAANTLLGNEGNNTLDGGTGADTLTGGLGNDTYVVDNAGDIVIENASEGTDTVLSSVSYTLDENIENSSLVDSNNINLTGNTLNNTLAGNSGNNTLDGGAGNDRMEGGAGDDVYIVDSTSDYVVEGTDEGTDSVISEVTYTLGTNIENLSLTGSGNINATGNALDNILIGNSGNNTLNGQAGADTMIGGDGYDVYIVDNAADIVTENADEGIDLVQSSVSYTLQNHIENLTLTGSSNLDGTGNALDNILLGSSGVNVLSGAGGNDTLNGGSNADTLLGGTGDDVYIVDNVGDIAIENADEGTDTVQSSVSWTLEEHFEHLTLTGSSAVNGTGNDTDNILTGNTGANTLDGGIGSDTMTGGYGNDVYIVDNVGDTVVELASQGTDTVITSLSYVLIDNVENLTLTGSSDINATGNDLNNIIIGNEGNNTLVGHAGNDTLDGGIGADAMIGGVGNDVYVVDHASDIVIESASEGTDTVQASIGYALGDNIERLTLIGTDNINATGNELNNTLVGNSGNNTLDGGTGNDRMEGAAGDDIYIVDSSSDTVIEGNNNGMDIVLASASFSLGNYVENLTLTGISDINGTGNSLENILIGNSGNNTLNGGSGVDTLIGGLGDDVYVVDHVDDVVTEAADEGTDTIQSSITWTLDEHFENLTLTGSAAINGTGNEVANILIGNSGANILSSGDGNDTLNGGSNADTLIGGMGDDVYIVDNVGDVVVEEDAEGIDTIQSSVTYTLSSHVENLELTGSSAIHATGNSLNNTLTGNAGANTLDGGSGADAMIGGAGHDTYIVDNVGDLVSENASQGTDTVLSSVSYTLTENVENLTLTGMADINGTGNDLINIITGNDGSNTLSSYGGNDTLDGGIGADTMIGGLGNDLYFVDDMGDLVVENSAEGTDAVQASISYALTDNVENLTLLGSGDIHGTGNDLNNTLTGNGGNNTLDGGAGNDRLQGGAGDDVYIVDSSSDVVVESSNGGTDLVLASASFSLGNYLENLTLTGTADINGTGNSFVNIIIGNSGNNTLNGGTGADTMIGGLGNDYYIIDNASDVVVEAEDEGNDTIQTSLTWTLEDYFENLIFTGSAALSGTGNSLDNAITGNSGVNILTGYAGNDTLDGMGGADTMIGGIGDDVYVVNHVGDVVIENDEEGTDTVQSSISYTLGDYLENLTLTGSSSLTAIGNSGNNIIIGNTGANTLDGSTGADTMIGGAGHDIYIVDDIGDTVIESAAQGTDTVRSYVSYTLTDEVERLELMGSGDLNGTGNVLSNILTGNSGNNTLDGGLGNDTLIGGSGDDVYIVDSASDVVSESASSGTDLVLSSVTYTISDADVENLTLTGSANINASGNSSANELTGNAGDNVLSGANGNDILFGMDGNDSLNGGYGDDILSGGAGTDILTGASNADIFVFDIASYGSVDIVTDFSTAQGDALDIRDLLDGFDAGTHDITDWLRITDSGSNSIVEVDRDGVDGGYGWTQIATLNNVTGLTDEAALVVSNNLLVA